MNPLPGADLGGGLFHAKIQTLFS